MTSTETTTAAQESADKPESCHSGSMGMVRGIPGKHIDSVGVLDLRGITPEQLKELQSIDSVGIVLVDPELRTAMSHIKVNSVGSIVDVSSDYQVMIEPWIELSRAAVEAMQPGQKLAMVGSVLFKSDIPAALVAEKFASLIVVGVLMSTGAVQGALIGKMQINGMSVTIPEGDLPFVHSMGENKVTPGYLTYLADGVVYINVGQTEILPEVTEELLARKIASYYNVGQTIAPQWAQDLLKARCPVNLGQFTSAEE